MFSIDTMDKLRIFQISLYLYITHSDIKNDAQAIVIAIDDAEKMFRM